MMVSRLVYVAAIAALTLGGCASGGYGGGYDGGYSGGYDGGYYTPYPAETYSYNSYYYGGPYYYGDGGYYGGGAFFGSDSEDEFHPRHSNDDHKDSDDQSHRFFNPGHGVTCDRRARTCFDDGRADRGLTEKFFGGHSDPRVGSGGPRPRAMPDDQRNAFNAQPDRHLNRPAQMPQQPQMHGMVNNGGNVPPRPRPNAQPGQPVIQNGAEPCPPKGCPNR